MKIHPRRSRDTLAQLCRGVLFILWAVVVRESVASGPFVYLSIAGENRIAVYELDPASGELSAVDSVEVDGGPGAMALHPNRKILYASVRSAGNLASFKIDTETGKLKVINQVSAGADPSYVAVDQSGEFLLSAYYRAGKVTVHAIADSGEIGKELQSIETDEKAHCIVADPSSNFWFVAHTGPNAIFQFRFDRAAGKLIPSDPMKLVRKPNTGPRHIWFHPAGNFAYTSDEQGRAVSMYRFDPRRGVLELLQTISTLPPSADRSQGGSTSDIEVHPSGRFVYVANRGHDSIAHYQVVGDTGLLRYLGNTKTEATTRSFNIDPNGEYLIAAGQKSGKVVVFSIDSEFGTLTEKSTIDVGKAPWWVLIR